MNHNIFLSLRCGGFFGKFECKLSLNHFDAAAFFPKLSAFYYILTFFECAITNLHSICGGPHPGGEVKSLVLWVKSWYLRSKVQYCRSKVGTGGS